MTAASPCPDQSVIDRLARLELPAREADSLFDHIDGCKVCQQRFDRAGDGAERVRCGPKSITRSDLETAAHAVDDETLRATAREIWDRLADTGPSRPARAALHVPCQVRQYQITRLIDEGGMGEVYEGLHLHLQRPVAVKVIRSLRRDDPVAREGFLREMAAAGQLDHPNLVRTYDAWEHDGDLFLAQELLEGESLFDLAERGGLGGVEAVVAAMVGVCQGLEQLHAQGLVHRDVTPANVMRLADGSIKLIDFGLAGAAGSAQPGAPESPGGIVGGTRGFMAPEQRAGRHVDARSDVYAVGRLLTFLLERCDVEGEGSGSERGSGAVPVRARLLEIAAECTRKNPAERPEDVEPLLEAFVALAKSPAAGAEGTTEQVPLRPRVARRLGVLALPLLVLGGLFASPGLLGTFSADESPPLEIAMTEVPAGRFLMGAAADDTDALANELPQHEVVFEQPFRISTHEITVGEFRAFVEDSGYVTEAEASGEGGWMASIMSTWGAHVPDLSWKNPGYPLADSLPVTVVTYADAVAFCEWLSERNGARYRLPTEAEWEYACRADTTTPFPFELARRDAHSWTRHNSSHVAKPHPVGTRLPNRWGIHDMVGNVREWCADWYDPKAYEQASASARPDQVPAGPAAETLRSVRGACFMDLNASLRSCWRGWLKPSEAANNQGFRVMEEVRGEKPASL